MVKKGQWKSFSSVFNHFKSNRNHFRCFWANWDVFRVIFHFSAWVKNTVYSSSVTLVPPSSSWLFFYYVSIINIYRKKQFSTRESSGPGLDPVRNCQKSRFWHVSTLENIFHKFQSFRKCLKMTILLLEKLYNSFRDRFPKISILASFTP